MHILASENNLYYCKSQWLKVLRNPFFYPVGKIFIIIFHLVHLYVQICILYYMFYKYLVQLVDLILIGNWAEYTATCSLTYRLMLWLLFLLYTNEFVFEINMNI